MRGLGLRIMLMAAASLLLLACTEKAPAERAWIAELLSSEGTKLERLAVGTQTFIRVDVQLHPPGLPVRYDWALGRVEATEHGLRLTPGPEHAGEIAALPQEPGGYYQAPAQSGTINVTLIVRYNGESLTRKSFKLEVVDERAAGASALPSSPTASPGAPEPPGRDQGLLTPVAGTLQDTPPPPDKAEEGPWALAVNIRRPQAGARVPAVITAEGSVRALRAGEHLALLVRPAADPTEAQPWVVQASPRRHPDGTWTSAPVLIGFPDDLLGAPFSLCVVITSEELSPGQRWTEFPSAVFSYCVPVRRG